MPTLPNTEAVPHDPLQKRRQLLDKAMLIFNRLRSGTIELRIPGDHRTYEYDRAIAGDIAAELAEEEPRWRCYHCDFVTNDHTEAAEHFGPNEVDAETPVCVAARNTSLEQLVATNRELWVRLQKEMQDNETVEFQLHCWEQVGRKLTGKSEANWHDFAADGNALYEKERSRRLLSEKFLSHLISHLNLNARADLAEAFRAYDPLLVSPEEYLESLKRPL